VGRPALTERDRVLFKLLASKLRSWRQALAIVQPDTVLRWHRELFRCVWRHKSRRKRMRGRPPLTEDVVRLIKRIAKENHTWRAERINGELLKLGVRVAKSTIQKYSQVARGPRSPKQSWSTFLWNQAR
jgi:putative transposase